VALLAVVFAVGSKAAVAVAPILTVPGDMTAEATSAAGATVTYSVSSDIPDASVSCNPPSGSVFALGTTTVTCTAADPATGDGASASFAVTVNDTTPPSFSTAPEPVTIRVNGVRQTAVTYTTPDAEDAVDGSRPVRCAPKSGSRFALGTRQVVCAAADTRGNVGSVTFTVRVLDTELPAPVTDLVVRTTASRVTLKWRSPADLDAVGTQVVRYPGGAVVFRGQGTRAVDASVHARARYRYVVRSYDRADNMSRAVVVSAVARRTALIEPQKLARLTVPPLLAWQPIDGARYYNVQLWAVEPSRLVKIFSDWPTEPRLQLLSTWTYGGKAQRLTRGTYRWYVWPGFGPLSNARYGDLIGSKLFFVVP
jgi:hypothetical protein